GAPKPSRQTSVRNSKPFWNEEPSTGDSRPKSGPVRESLSSSRRNSGSNFTPRAFLPYSGAGAGRATSRRNGVPPFSVPRGLRVFASDSPSFAVVGAVGMWATGRLFAPVVKSCGQLGGNGGFVSSEL